MASHFDSRRLARFMFHAHLWLGVVITAILIIIAVTGVMLNHKRGLGLMPNAQHEASGEFRDALPLAALADSASTHVGPAIAASGIDRMDVRPSDGLVKVRFNDRVVTEVDVDIINGRIISSDQRNDVFLEKLHSAEILGKRWVILSDIAAIGLIVVLISGVFLWLYPRSRA